MNEINLQDILEEYAMAATGGAQSDPLILRRMLAKYPQYSEELKDFAAARAVVRFAPEPEFSSAEETRFEQIGMQNLRRVLGDAAPQTAALPSLTGAAKARGLNKKSFAGALGLSVSLVQYLEKRRLAFATIPQALVARIAEVLGAGEEIVSAYLAQPPDFAPGASYKTGGRAEEQPPKSFAAAVSEDQTLSAEEKRKLLEM